MAERIPMTPEGYAKLQEDLHQLKTVERHKNIRDIEEARAHGDLSENAEYQYAKERQGQIAGMIQHLEDQIARADVIDPKTIKSDRVVFGATVKLLDLEEEKEVTYRIVGPPEADAKQNRISIFSPLAKAMIGKKVEDEVEVPTPQGERFYEILSIRFE
jgi:transcription elongation factor GreA